MYHQLISFLPMLASIQLASVAASVLPIGYCPPPTAKYTADAGPVFWDPPVLDTNAESCESNAVEPCTLGVSQSITNSVTITDGGSFTLDL